MCFMSCHAVKHGEDRNEHQLYTRRAQRQRKMRVCMDDAFTRSPRNASEMKFGAEIKLETVQVVCVCTVPENKRQVAKIGDLSHQ